MPAAKLLIAYIVSRPVADNAYMGGIMVTDTLGMPREFRYTEPVRATKLQRVLYGDVLERYILCEVIAASLVGRLETVAGMVITGDPELLPALESSGRPAAQIAHTRVAALKGFGTTQDVSEIEFLLQLSETSAPMRVRLPRNDAARKAEAARLLGEAARTMEILEPLARIDSAINMLWDEAVEANPA